MSGNTRECAWLRARHWKTLVLLLLLLLVLSTPCSAFFTFNLQDEEQQQDQQEPLQLQELSQQQQQQQQQQQEASMSHLLDAINRVSQALETHERHTSLYERVALLEASLAEKTAREAVLQAEVTQLRVKIPELEAEIEIIPEMRKELGEFEAKIEKLVQDYEVKLSTLASEVIRLKKYGARRKDFMTLSDGSNVLLRAEAPVPTCPEVGQSMVAERVGEQCLYFSFGTARNWTAAHHHCQALRGEMAAPPDLTPLKSFLRHAFTRGPSLWLGSSYNFDEDTDEGEDDNEDEDASGLVGKVLEEEVEASPAAQARQETVDMLQADGVMPVHRDRLARASEPFFLRLKESPAEEEEDEEEHEVLGSSGNTRFMLDQVQMMRDDLLARYRGLSLADEPAEHPRQPDPQPERRGGSSVVDIVLLAAPERHQQDAEPRASANQSAISGQDSVTRLLQDGISGSGGGSMEEAAASVHVAAKASDSHKPRMKCMLLRQSESLEYEVVGRPCDEVHNYVCDFKLTLDTLQPE